MRIILPENKVSIIIPCYNEVNRLGKIFIKIDEFLKDRPYIEIVFVNDGSKDQTAFMLSHYAKGKKNIKVIDNKINKGKWGAIKAGYFCAKGSICIILDADLSVNFGYIDEAVSILKCRDDILIGNRYSGKSRIPIKRYIVSKCFNICVRMIVGLELKDTQCPLKAFRRESVYDVFLNLSEERYCGDVDFLRGCFEEDKYIIELPVIYDFVEGSHVSIKKHGWEMFKSLFDIRRKYQNR